MIGNSNCKTKWENANPLIWQFSSDSLAIASLN